MKEIQNKEKNAANQSNRSIITKIIASVSIVTTLGIIFTLSNETIIFFKNTITLLLTEKNGYLFEDPKFGILPLICGTVLVTAIAMCVATPIGLACAVFLSEYASNGARKVLKLMLELLAGIPTIVYGFCINSCYTAFTTDYT